MLFALSEGPACARAFEADDGVWAMLHLASRSLLPHPAILPASANTNEVDVAHVHEVAWPYPMATRQLLLSLSALQCLAV